MTTCAGLAALTGGVWFCHNLFLTTLRTVLQTIGVWGRLPWEAIVPILFVGTVGVSVAFVSLVLRTPLRWVLGGPVRSEQRAEYSSDPHYPSAPDHPSDADFRASELLSAATPHRGRALHCCGC